MSTGIEGILRARRKVANQPPSFARGRQIEDVVDAGADQDHSGDAVDDAAHLLAHAQHFANQESGNLSAKPVMTRMMKLVSRIRCCQRWFSRHAHHEGVLHPPPGHGLAAPDDEVVQEHGADDERISDDVNHPHPATRWSRCRAADAVFRCAPWSA